MPNTDVVSFSIFLPKCAFLLMASGQVREGGGECGGRKVGGRQVKRETGRKGNV